MLEERRPSKKKKKKQKTNNMALALGIVAGVLLLSGVVVVVIVVTAGGNGPDTQVKAKDPPAPVQPPVVPAQVQKKPPLSGVARRMDIIEVRNMMKQLGLAYVNYELTSNRAPARWQDLRPYYENNSKINEALSDGSVVFICNVRPAQMRQGAGNTILAYEAAADGAGIRVVLMGNGQTQDMNEQTFDATPKAGN